MANDIYSKTHSGLSELVSPRVASRVLEGALRKRKLSPDNVTAKDMKSLLRGPIFNDLTGILPRGGLEHSLYQLSKSVAKLKSPLKTTPSLVEAVHAPEPWDDSPPVNQAKPTPDFEFEEDSRDLVGSPAGVLEESLPPQQHQPKVEMTQTVEPDVQALSFDSDAPIVDVGETTLEADGEAAPGNQTTSPASEAVTTEPATTEPESLQASTEKLLQSLEAQSLERSSVDEAPLVAEDTEAQGTQEPLADSLFESDVDAQEIEIPEPDPYATLIDTPLAEILPEAAEPEPPYTSDNAVATAHRELDSAAPKDISDAEAVAVAEPERHTPLVLDHAALEAAILQFAQLDHVRMVAALLANGSVASSRGDGFDLETLSRLGTLGLKLLSRSGELRSYYLAFKEGQLFFFPLPGYTLCIIGTTELNLGLVFATLQKLKEDA